MLFALLACTSTGDTGTDPCGLEGEPTLRIGTGEVIFEELPEGPVELIYGPQGGYHVVLALEATHFPLDEQLVAGLSGTVDGVEVAHTQPFVTLRCNAAAGAQQAWNLFLILDEGLLPEDVHGRDMAISARLTGSTAESSASADIEVSYPDLD